MGNFKWLYTKRRTFVFYYKSANSLFIIFCVWRWSGQSQAFFPTPKKTLSFSPIFKKLGSKRVQKSGFFVWFYYMSFQETRVKFRDKYLNALEFALIGKSGGKKEPDRGSSEVFLLFWSRLQSRCYVCIFDPNKVPCRPCVKSALEIWTRHDLYFMSVYQYFFFFVDDSFTRSTTPRRRWSPP